MARADRRVDTLPVESVTTGGTERFEPRAADVKQYATAAFPDALLGVGKRRPRVEILNGTGAVGLAQTIASRVVPAGGQVTLTGNVANFGLTETQVVYYRPADRAAAQRLLPSARLRGAQEGRHRDRGGRRHDPGRGRLLPDRSVPAPWHRIG